MVCKSLICLAPGYLSSKIYIRAGIYFMSYNLRNSERSLLFPCHEPNTIEIASATAGLFCGTFLANLPSDVRQEKSLTNFRKLSKF